MAAKSILPIDEAALVSYAEVLEIKGDQAKVLLEDGSEALWPRTYLEAVRMPPQI